MKYISVKVRNALVMHGYTSDNHEIIEKIEDEPFVEKLLLVDRIQSVSEKYILCPRRMDVLCIGSTRTDSLHSRISWPPQV